MTKPGFKPATIVVYPSSLPTELSEFDPLLDVEVERK